MLTLQRLIADLEAFWEEEGCLIEQPYDMPMGAGTMHPATFLKVLGPDPWRCAYVQPSRRPADGRYGENPFRLGKHLQLQVVLKPSPDDVQGIYLRSLERLGIDLAEHDIRFEEDNWEAPTLGAWGVGWQVVMDGMEITQFTYFQQAGGIDLSPITAEITYGLERIAMFLSKVNSIYDVMWNETLPYGEVRRCRGGRAVAVRLRSRRRRSSRRCSSTATSGRRNARSKRAACSPPTRRALSCSHAFNLLDARGAVSATDRVGLIRRVRDLACSCARAYLAAREGPARAVSQPEPAAV